MNPPRATDHSSLVTDHPRVCIIILNWNGLEDTIECLESLKRITYPEYEVIVVDNGSEGNDVEVLRERFGDYVHVIENDVNYGFAEGSNIGMRYALGTLDPDYVLLLNSDTLVDPDFLTELIKVAEGDSRIGIVGPKIRFYGQSNRIQSAGARINWWTGETSLAGCTKIDRGQFDKMKEVDWVSGCALLIKCETIEEIGLLYAGYFGYFEETEWCARCRKAGYKVVYVPAAKLWHKGRRTTEKVEGFRLYYMTRNQFLFMKRNSTRVQFLSFFVWFFLRHFVVTTMLLILRRDVGLMKRFYRGIYDGITTR